MKTIKDLLDGQTSAEVVCLYKRDVVRRLTVNGDTVVIDFLTESTTVPLDTPLKFEPWVMDRGNFLCQTPLGVAKFCTEADLIRFPGGLERHIVPTADTDRAASRAPSFF